MRVAFNEDRWRAGGSLAVVCRWPGERSHPTGPAGTAPARHFHSGALPRVPLSQGWLNPVLRYRNADFGFPAPGSPLVLPWFGLAPSEQRKTCRSWLFWTIPGPLQGALCRQPLLTTATAAPSSSCSWRGSRAWVGFFWNAEFPPFSCCAL